MLGKEPDVRYCLMACFYLGHGKFQMAYVKICIVSSLMYKLGIGVRTMDFHPGRKTVVLRQVFDIHGSMQSNRQFIHAPNSPSMQF